MLNEISAVILDMDGTLIDSMGIWHEIDKKFFQENNLKLPKGLSNQVNKMTMQEWAAFFVREFRMNLTEEQIIRRIGEMCYEYYAHVIPLKPHVTEFLDTLDAHRLPYGIATATYRKSAEAALARLGILDRMQFIITAEEVPSSKKDPEMFLKAAEHLGTSPEKTLVVEDALHCIQTAKNAGFRTIGVYDSSVPAHEWKQIQQISDVSGTDFQEILGKIL